MSAPRGAGHKCAGWSHKSVSWVLSGNKALLVSDAIYGYRLSIWQNRTNCYWGKFPRYAGNKKSCPDFWCIIELEPDNGLGAFQQEVVNFGKTRGQLRSSSYPTERLLSVHRLWGWMCPSLQWICLALSLSWAKIWLMPSQSQSCIQAQNKNCKTHSPLALSTLALR